MGRLACVLAKCSVNNVCELASKLKYAISPFPMTVPNSLFSKMIMTTCEKFGTSGGGARVGSIVGVGSGVRVRTGNGARVGRD